MGALVYSHVMFSSLPGQPVFTSERLLQATLTLRHNVISQHTECIEYIGKQDGVAQVTDTPRSSSATGQNPPTSLVFQPMHN